MPKMLSELEIERCPHCSVNLPSLRSVTHFETNNYSNSNKWHWKVFVCSRCGQPVLAGSKDNLNGEVHVTYPSISGIDENIPERTRDYLKQASETIHAASGSIMLSASAVDAMLKNKGYTEGSLYTRIDEAKDKHLITNDMAAWAHEVRLDSNEQRHADEDVDLPDEVDAKKSLEFALALAEFIFVLPARIQRGLSDTKKT